MTDKTPGACQCHEKHAPTYWKSVVREYKDALEKAEQERDEAQERNARQADMLADTPRPLTPDAITDEMVERALGANGQPETSVDSPSGRRMRHILTAALTEPPARPEGAEDIEALIREAVTASGTLDDEALADYLAARLTDPTRKEA